MRKATLTTSCTAQSPGGKFCDRTSVPDAPFPICTHHAAEVYRFLRGRIEGAEVRSFDRVLDDISMERTKNGRYRDTLGAPASEVVYYVQVGDLIKIGRTSDLRRRLATGYPPNTRVLATEHGDAGLEARRLEQFRAARAARVEWHRPAPALLAHIDALRAARGHAPLERDTPSVGVV